jgi:Copper binding proteins, plastocyanin/azurin family
MKRVLVAAALGGLLLVGTPTLASSAQRNDTKAEKNDNADKGGDKSDHGGNKSGDHGDRSDNHGDRDGHRGDRDGHRGDRDGHRYGDRYGDRYYGYPGYGGYYGDPYDCYYGRSGAYNCEEYGGDGYPGYGYGGSHRGDDGTVVVRGMAFNPPETHIRPGDDVTWIFQDREPHTVTADNNSFDSGKRQDGEFRLSFDQPGSYSYHCAIHPDMKGRVIVG